MVCKIITLIKEQKRRYWLNKMIKEAENSSYKNQKSPKVNLLGTSSEKRF